MAGQGKIFPQSLGHGSKAALGDTQLGSWEMLGCQGLLAAVCRSPASPPCCPALGGGGGDQQMMGFPLPINSPGPKHTGQGYHRG